ncbi:MAG: hypothetical protein ACE14M_03490 [Terriglobales bacterium]
MAKRGTAQPDPVRQTSVGPSAPASVGLNFDGLAAADDESLYGSAYAPSDTNGAVGSTQYVQMVNDAIAVFNKTTGAMVIGPVSITSVWSLFGGACENDGSGDPIVLYDKLANRWIISEMAWPASPPAYECVAISQTDDATGSYYRYAFPFSDYNDYPKLGVWPDGYYLSVNRFDASDNWVGTSACAMDRASMLTGAGATMVCMNNGTDTGIWSLLPSDLDGANAPPANSPNFFVELDWTDFAHLRLWKFHVDFTTPANSTFTGPTSLAVAGFSPTCLADMIGGSGRGQCVPQAGTANLLESLGDRVMHRLAYRNFGTHESLVVNHSVGEPAGMRWYEIRDPNGTATLYQQGTFDNAGDGIWRWMGSAAMDGSGNMLVGYSATSSSISPGIRFTGRLATDTLGTLQSETTITLPSNGSVTSGHRWGDYSSMSVDPVDDCTFWYTTQYLPANDDQWTWRTRIVTMNVPSCSGSKPDLVMGKSHLGNFVQGQIGGSANYTLAVSNVGGAPTDGSTVTVVDTLPSGLTATAIAGSGWSCTLATLTCTRSDVLNSPASYPAIIVTVDVSSSAPSLVTNSVTVSGGGDPGGPNNTATDDTTILAPDFTLAVTSSPSSVNAGQSATAVITLTPNVVTVAATTFACSGLPAYSSCTFSPTSVPAQSGATDVTVTVHTTGPYAALHQSRTFYAAWLPFTGFGMIGIVLLGTRKRNREATVILTAFLLMLILLPVMGCGSSSVPPPPRTPSGTSTVTVTATSSSVVHTTTFNLTVN